MSSKDFLQRFIFEDAPVRGEYIYLHNAFQTIINQHNYPLPIRRLLGEALSIAGLISAIIKFEGRLTVQFRGEGKLKLLLAQCSSDHHLRGLAKWEGKLSYDELMNAFHQGVLVIMVDAGLKSRYQGIVSWRGDSLADSIENYFRESEQLATKIWLDVNDSAAGLLLQSIPESDDRVTFLEKEEKLSAFDRIVTQTTSVNLFDLVGKHATTLIEKKYPEENIRLFPSIEIAFNCTCTRVSGEEAIFLLGREEAEAEIKNKHSIVVTCDFCNKSYVFDRKDLDKIFSRKDNQTDNNHLH